MFRFILPSYCSEAESRRPTWTTRFSPFQKPGNRILKPVGITQPPANGVSSILNDFRPLSTASSMISTYLTISSSTLHSNLPLNSHRSQSIKRDKTSHPASVPNTATMCKGVITDPLEEEGLILTVTSKYPTGVAADIYVPEDCSREGIKERIRENRKILFRNGIIRNSSLIKHNSGIKSPEERRRLKRISVNF